MEVEDGTKMEEEDGTKMEEADGTKMEEEEATEPTLSTRQVLVNLIYHR